MNFIHLLSFIYIQYIISTSISHNLYCSSIISHSQIITISYVYIVLALLLYLLLLFTILSSNSIASSIYILSIIYCAISSIVIHIITATSNIMDLVNYYLNHLHYHR